MKDKIKYLFKNTGLLLVGNFASKVLVFLLVPFYTSILSTYEYGIYDLLFTTIQLLVPILTLNAVDAVIRFPIGASKEQQTTAFTFGVKCAIFSVFLSILGTIAAGCLSSNEIIRNYGLFFVILFAAYAINNIVCQFARGIDDVKGLAIAGVIGTISMVAFNILFLLFMKLGLVGYFWAMILSLAIPVLYLIIRDRLWIYIRISFFTCRLNGFEKEMLRYCLPLMFINVSWYINNVADRYAITWLCGMADNGVYSVSYKLPAILNAIQVVFIQAWQLSAVKEYKDKNSAAFYNSVYNGCQFVMVVLCSSLILVTKPASRILFSNEFYEAWKYVPYLLIYIVFNTLSGTVGGIFSATKETKNLAYSSIVGAIVNIILNFVLVYTIGVLGAAVATLISSIIIWLLRMRALKSHLKLCIKFPVHIAQYFILIIQATVLIFMANTKIMYCFEVIALLGIVGLGVNDIRNNRRSCQ